MAYTDDFKEAINSVSGTEHPFVLAEISHPDLPTPVRIVNDTDDFVHNSVTYTGLPFRIQMPSDPEVGAGRARLVVDNVGRVLTEWLETSRGGVGATVKLTVVLPSDPNTAQYETTLNLSNVSMSQEEVVASLGYTDIFNRPGIRWLFDRQTTPAIF